MYIREHLEGDERFIRPPFPQLDDAVVMASLRNHVEIYMGGRGIDLVHTDKYLTLLMRLAPIVYLLGRDFRPSAELTNAVNLDIANFDAPLSPLLDDVITKWNLL